jgi:signal transduction histidine kinase
MVNSLPSEKAALTHETKISKRGTTSPFNLDIDTQSTYEVIFLDVTSTSKTFSNLVITFILVGIATLIIIYAISIYFANRAIKPIEEAFTKQKQFIADASHELKTPLAIINANHDVLFSNKEHTIQSQIKWLNYIEIQIGRMSKLINNLLYLAKIDYVDNSEFIKLPFNISELIEEVVLCINAISFEKGIKINLDIKNNIIIKSDSDKIRQVISILIDNAIKYSPRNYSVDIHASQKKGQFLFCISNVCKDIKEESLSKLFDRFYRTDPSRNHNDTVGYGLGLAIAKAIIEKLGGKINVRLKNNIIEFYFVLKKKVSN